MRAVSLSDGFDMDKVLRAVTAEIKSHMEENGSPNNAFLVISVRVCRDEEPQAHELPLIGA